MKIEGCVALVTGAASGFGKAFTIHLLKHGAKVLAVDIDKDCGEELVKNCDEEFVEGNVKFLMADVSDSMQLQNAFEEAIREFKRLDIVCNNAGFLNKTHNELVENFANNQIGKLIDVQLTAMIEGTYLAIQKMSKRKGGNGGVVINTASVAGLRVEPFFMAYTAAKQGVVAFTHSFKFLDNWNEDGIRVNCLCPHIAETPLLKSHTWIPEYILQNSKFIEVSQVVQGLAQVIEDDTLNGDAIAILPDNVIKKAELTHPKSPI